MSDIIVKQQPTTSLTVQSNSTQLLIRQAAANNITVSTTGNSYVLPAATNSTLGGIIAGDNLSINANGVLSAQAGGVTSFNNRTGNVTLTANDVTAVASGIYQANGSYLNDLLTTVPMSYGSDALAGMRKSAGGPANFVAGPTSVGGFATVGIVAGNEVSAVEFGIGDVFAKLRLRHYKHTLLIADYGIFVETGTANWTWEDNSILTQGRADSRYIEDSTVLTGVPMSYGNDIFYGHYQTRGPSPGFPFVAGSLLTQSRGVVGVANAADPCTIEFLPGDAFNQMRFRSYNQSLLFAQSGFIAETGTANWTWSANSILTQGRADSRYYFANNPSNYLPSANFTYANIGGTIPTATNTTLGAIKVGSNLTIANGVLSATSSGGTTAAKAIAYSIILGR
jgi:hypothetical protein